MKKSKEFNFQPQRIKRYIPLSKGIHRWSNIKSPQVLEIHKLQENIQKNHNQKIKEQTLSQSAHAHEQKITCLSKLSQTHLATAGFDYEFINIWSSENFEIQQQFESRHQSKILSIVCLNSDTILSGSQDGEIHIFHPTSDQFQLEDVIYQDGPISQLLKIDKEKFAAGNSKLNQIFVYDIQDIGTPLAVIQIKQVNIQEQLKSPKNIEFLYQHLHENMQYLGSWRYNNMKMNNYILEDPEQPSKDCKIRWQSLQIFNKEFIILANQRKIQIYSLFTGFLLGIIDTLNDWIMNCCPINKNTLATSHSISSGSGSIKVWRFSIDESGTRCDYNSLIHINHKPHTYKDSVRIFPISQTDQIIASTGVTQQEITLWKWNEKKMALEIFQKYNTLGNHRTLFLVNLGSGHIVSVDENLNKIFYIRFKKYSEEETFYQKKKFQMHFAFQNWSEVGMLSKVHNEKELEQLAREQHFMKSSTQRTVKQIEDTSQIIKE